MNEVLLAFLGLVMLYALIHAVVIISKKLKRATKYEKVVLCVGFVASFLYLAGTLSQ